MMIDDFESPLGDEKRTYRTHFRFRRGPAALWALRNPVLYSGEPGAESDTSAFKIGDGVTRWNDLPYYLDHDAMIAQVVEEVSTLGSVTAVDFQAHINSEDPHPVYDDGTSFLLRYLNAKV